jgi:hypothetical protein
VALQHQLSNTGVRIPELYTTVLRSTQYPVAVGGKRNGKDKVLVALKSADTLATRSARMSRSKSILRGELPHLDRLVQTTGNKAVSRGSERDAVDAVFMAVFALETYDELTGLNVPYANALVKGAGGDVEVVWRDGYSGDAVLNGKVGHLHVGFKIPEADAPIAATGCNDLAVPGEVERVDVLLVSGKLMLDRAAVNIPNLVHMSVAASSCRKIKTYPDDLVFSTSCQVLPVGTEADAPNVQISIFREAAILEMRDGTPGLDVEDLGRAVAASGDKSSVQAETYAAHDTLMRQVVNQVDVKDTP